MLLLALEKRCQEIKKGCCADRSSPLCNLSNPRLSRGYFFFFAFLAAFFFATVYRSPPIWSSGAHGALLYASFFFTCPPMRSVDGYRASPKGAGTSKKILARKFGYEHSLPFIIGYEREKVHLEGLGRNSIRAHLELIEGVRSRS